MITLEVCIDTPDAIETCVAEGVDRIELCSALAVGGLTPSHGLMEIAAQSSVPAHAMIRPVAGDFVLNDAVLKTMLGDIKAARDAGLAGVVIGALTSDRRLDHDRLRQFITAAGPLDVTLHRAIDLCADPLRAVEEAADLGMTRILTSGAAHTAFAGRVVIAQMVKRAAGRVTIMPGSGITAQNVAALVQDTGVRDVHASCAMSVPEASDITAFSFGPAQKRMTDGTAIAAMQAALGRRECDR
jgi:copper homeostasis protein